MKRILLILIAGLAVPAGLYAQKVYARGSQAILDMTVVAGMPAGAQTSESKTQIYDAATPKEDSYINGNRPGEKLNEKVYQKLGVSLYDSSTTMYWVDAYNYCQNLSEAGNSDWRLPTHRELQMIYIFQIALKSVIEKLGGGGFKEDGYWAATEGEPSWYPYSCAGEVVFKDGQSRLSTPKVNSLKHFVRCVREVAD